MLTYGSLDRYNEQKDNVGYQFKIHFTSNIICNGKNDKGLL